MQTSRIILSKKFLNSLFLLLTLIVPTSLSADQAGESNITIKLKRGRAPSSAESYNTIALPISRLRNRAPRTAAALPVVTKRGVRLQKIFRGETQERFKISGSRGPLYNVFSVKTKPGTDRQLVCEELMQLGELEYCQPDVIMRTYALPNDEFIDPDQNGIWESEAWGNTHSDLWGLQAVRAVEAWDSMLCNGSQCLGQGVVAAVVDSGVHASHPDLAANMYVNPNEIAGNGIDDDNNGFVDDTQGWNFSNADNKPTDGHGHGTHCAGTIAAVRNNGIGIAGVAPAAKILPIKGLGNSGSGPMSDLAASIIYATTVLDYNKDGKVDLPLVINNSWGCFSACQSLPVAEDAVLTAIQRGAIVVFAAGNSNSNVENFSPQNLSDAITVGAVTHAGARADFSNYGALVDIAAPGGGGTGFGVSPGRSILSLLAPGSVFATEDYSSLRVGTEYLRLSGTSMAAPHVVGAIAVLLSHRPNLTQFQVEQILRFSAMPIPMDKPIGAGIIDTRAALSAVIPVNTAPSILTQPLSQTVTVGELVTFKVIASGDTPRTYQWQRNGVDLNSETRPTLSFLTTGQDNGAQYSCRVSNSHGSIVSNNASLTAMLPPPPSITTQPISVNTYQDAWVSFRVAATGSPPLTYQWQKNGINISGATTPYYRLQPTTNDNGAQFRCVVSNSGGSVTSDSAPLTVTSYPSGSYCLSSFIPTFEWIAGVGSGSFVNSSGGTAGYENFSNLTAFTAQVGSTVILSLTPGYAGDIYGEKWSVWIDLNGDGDLYDLGERVYTSPIRNNGVEVAPLPIPASTATGTTRMRISMGVINNTNPCDQSGLSGQIEDYSVTFIPNPNIPPSITTQPGSRTVYTGTSATFNVTADGSAPLSYQWQRNGANISGATSTSYTFKPTSADNGAQFRCVVSNPAGNVTSNVAILTLTNTPINYCAANSNSTSVGWIAKVSSGGFTNVSGGAAGYENFTHLTAFSTRPGATVPINLTLGGAQNPNNWWVWIDLNRDEDFSDAGELVFSSLTPSPTVSADLAIPTSATAGATRMRVIMSVISASGPCGNLSFGQVEDYSVTISGTLPSPSPSPTPTLPSISTHPTSRTVIAGSSTTFNVVVAPNAPLSYQWQRNGANIAGATAVAYTTTPTLADNGAQFRCVVSNSVGSVTSNIATLTVTTPPTNYCAATSNASQEWIRDVKSGSFSNFSGGVAGYQDFTNLTVFSAKLGSKVPITLTPGFPGPKYQEHWKIWVDLNRDGDFDDVGELIYSTPTPSSSEVSTNLAIPVSASVGATRMRIRMHFLATPISPCGTLNLGQVEDYTVILDPA